MNTSASAAPAPTLSNTKPFLANPRVAVVGEEAFSNPKLATCVLARNVATEWIVPPSSSPDILLVFWNGQPGPEKDAIDQAVKRRCDVIAIRPDGTFTKMGFGQCQMK